MLDTPTEYLCGPWFSFHHDDEFHIFKNCDRDNPYRLINLKTSRMVTRLTVEFDEALKKRDVNLVKDDSRVRLRFFADVYFSKEDLTCVFFYTILNLTSKPFKNLTYYILYDFDVGGLAKYDTDHASYSEELQYIVQYDESGVHVGFSSLPPQRVSHYAAGHPYDLLLTSEKQCLDDTILKGPDDLFIGLEWNVGDLEPGHRVIHPVILAAGETKEEFLVNLKKGREKAEKLLRVIPKLVRLPERQTKSIDGDFEKMTEILERISSNNEC
ncbi:MAG: hypothetical protein ACTSUE_10260 [Promethearchaeota archaeon]